MKFVFKAKTSDGQLKEGNIEASSRDLAVRIIQQNKLIPISVESVRTRTGLLEKLQSTISGVKAKDKVSFFRSLAVLIDAKVPLLQALRSITMQTENDKFRAIIQDVTNDVEDGTSFAEAIAKHPDVFSRITISVVRAGELSGNLQKSILFLAENIEKNYKLNQKIKSALTYPGFILIAALVIGLVVASVILPKLTQVIRELDVDIPWYTLAVIGFGDFMESYWWLVILIFIVLAVSLRYYLSTPEGKDVRDRFLLRIPIFGELAKYVYFSRFAENFSMLITAGIPVVEALQSTADVVQNAVYRDIFLKTAEDVKSGSTIAESFGKYDEIPPLITNMTNVGESSGKIGEVFKQVAAYYDNEAENITRNLTALIEPFLIIVLGVGVAILVFSVLLPIYNIAGQF